MPSTWPPTSTSPATRSKLKGSRAPATPPWTPCHHQRPPMSPWLFQLSHRRKRKSKRLRTTREPSWRCLRETRHQSPHRLLTDSKSRFLCSTSNGTASGSNMPSCRATCPCAALPAPYCEQAAALRAYKATHWHVTRVWCQHITMVWSEARQSSVFSNFMVTDNLHFNAFWISRRPMGGLENSKTIVTVHAKLNWRSTLFNMSKYSPLAFIH